MNKFNFSVVWLKIASLLFALFGIMIALLNQTHIFQIAFNDQINPVFWKEAVMTAEAVYFQQWIYGLLGATCLMIGIMIFFIVKYAFAQRERWAWNCLIAGVAAWFIIDETISLYYAVYFNAVLNLVLLMAFLVPLFLTMADFKNQNFH